MKVLIVGTGAVGSAICAQLARERHNITVIDKNADELEKVCSAYDITGLAGNGADISLLKEAGAHDADILIAVTSSDEFNMLCCYAAKKIGAKHTIARVRNPEYNDFLSLTGGELGLALTINPEYEVASRIYRILRNPSATKLDSFYGGRVELAEFVVEGKAHICNLSLHDIRKKSTHKFIVCSVRRGTDVYIPGGDFVIREGDSLCVAMSGNDIASFFKEIGMFKKPARKIILTGGGRTSHYLGELLKKGRVKTEITAIESDKTLCEDIAKDFPWTVINGDPSNQDLLIEEGIDGADAFLALSSQDEENAISSMFAKTRAVPKIITLVTSLTYIDFFKQMGIESIVSPKHATVEQIMRFVRSLAASRDSEIESLHRIMDSDTEALEFIVKEHIGGITGIPIKDIKRKSNTIIASIIHEGEVIIPSGLDVINPGDTVIVIAGGKKLNSIKDII